jgi:hypothetical protein
MGAPRYRIDEGIKDFATESQRRNIDAVNEHGSIRAAAKALGIHNAALCRSIHAAERVAALRGYSPRHDMRHVVPDGFKVKGVSTYYDDTGKPRGQWVKSSADDERREAIVREAVASLMEETPRLAPLPGPLHVSDSLCNVFTLTDTHVGAYAWGKETGADWDLSIAERTVIGAVEHLVSACPVAGTAVVAQLGDFLHQDGLAAVTPTSGHNLDSDSRFSKVVQVAVRILRRVIDVALQRHNRVVVLMAEGNHDIASSVWLRHMFALLYENEPRVTVIDSELPYYVHQHGKTMLGWHHGHLKKFEQLPLLFAAQFPKVWGDTTRRYVHCGHMHHKHEKEHSGVTVIQHPTIAARDAYAARGGYMADRELTAITYSDRFGQVARATVSPEMLEPA